MGLASSQARLLLLTARKSDLEFRGQQINNRRLALTYKLEQVAKNYSDGISNKRIQVNLGSDQQVDVSLKALNQAGYSLYRGSSDDLSNAEKIPEKILTHTSSNGTKYWSPNPEFKNSADVDAGLRNGNLFLVAQAGEVNGKVNADYVVDWRSDGSNTVVDKLYQDDDEAVTAEYEYLSTLIQGQDKRLEMELKNIDSQHKAVETEMGSVKKIIDKNIQSSFKTFG